MVSEAVLGQLVRSATARDAWLSLEKSYASQSNMKILQLKKDLQDVRKDDKPMIEYLNHVKLLADSLSDAHEDVSDEDLVHDTLNGRDKHSKVERPNVTTIRKIKDLIKKDEYTICNASPNKESAALKVH
ncbi:hypothetical protein EJ110_NYTH52052 [Nymphaea thermarum]|nr:hypothetical protein EJ110_NYTH52052 [Nymphaea thermarum]